MKKNNAKEMARRELEEAERRKMEERREKRISTCKDLNDVTMLIQEKYNHILGMEDTLRELANSISEVKELRIKEKVLYTELLNLDLPESKYIEAVLDESCQTESQTEGITLFDALKMLWAEFNVHTLGKFRLHGRKE